MSSFGSVPPSDSGEPSERRLVLEGMRLSGRLRSLPPVRLAEGLPGYASRADAGRVAAQMFADLAAGVEARGAVDQPPWRDVPRLHDFAVGDQVAVTCADAVAAVGELVGSPGWVSETVWTREGRRPALEVVEAVLIALRDIRLAID